MGSAPALDQWKPTACGLYYANCGVLVQTGGEDARRIPRVKGDKIFRYGGGGQGNHLGGAYFGSVIAALGIRYKTNALVQEKTGWAWMMNRMFGGGKQVAVGVAPNELTPIENKDRFVGTPFHKYVPARLERV